ncbi:MAG: hypothetical protein EAX96_11740 [Candidatus Lokiarchaeota archaeon]|nr:hypothetical protein [Candidatus Lokiarchaeota archaeon]
MVRGLVLAKWDNKFGAILVEKFSDDKKFSISGEDLMMIYTFHSMGELTTGFMTMKREGLNVGSFFLNIQEKNEKYYLAVILNTDEDPNDFREVLTTCAEILMKTLIKPDLQDKHNFLPQMAVFYSRILVEKAAIQGKTFEDIDKRIKELDKDLKRSELELKTLIESDRIVELESGTIEDKYIKLRKEFNQLLVDFKELDVKYRELKIENEKMKKDLEKARLDGIGLRNQLLNKSKDE